MLSYIVVRWGLEMVRLDRGEASGWRVYAEGRFFGAVGRAPFPDPLAVASTTPSVCEQLGWNLLGLAVSGA